MRACGVARELCFRIIIPTEKQWSAYTWNRYAFVENRTSDSSPEISKVNWILNFSQAPYRSDDFSRGNRLSISTWSMYSSIFFYIGIFFIPRNGIKKLESVPLLPLWYSMCFLFTRAYIGNVEILVTSNVSLNIAWYYLFHNVLSCHVINYARIIEFFRNAAPSNIKYFANKRIFCKYITV